MNLERVLIIQQAEFELSIASHIATPVIVKFLSKTQPQDLGSYIRSKRSSFVSMIQSVLEFRFVRAILHTLIFQVISVLPISAKNAFVTPYLLESSLSKAP